jgi:hypothetical protein
MTSNSFSFVQGLLDLYLYPSKAVSSLTYESLGNLSHQFKFLISLHFAKDF